ncbi:MAG: hypothetical protein ACI88A_003567 [Paraglaciecola sp.]|jgi:hypothetical protein
MKLSKKTQCVLGLATFLSLSTQHANASFITNVTESGLFSQVYGLDIATNSDYNAGTPDYDINNTADDFGNVDRIGYYLELDNSWMWVSFNSYTQDLTQIGVPVGSTSWQQTIASMNVETNVAGITVGQGITTGNVEFWSSCYATNNAAGVTSASSNIYDYGDQQDTQSCYGSMQIHNYGAQETLFAYNAWDHGLTDDLGIGNNTSNIHTDWTFTHNTSSYNVRRLEVFVSSQSIRDSAQSVSTPTTISLFLIGLIALVARRKSKV